MDTFTVKVDSDHAGCLRTRRSTTGIAAYHGKHVTKAASTTQTVIALSSGESEFRAVVRDTATVLARREEAVTRQVASWDGQSCPPPFPLLCRHPPLFLPSLLHLPGWTLRPLTNVDQMKCLTSEFVAVTFSKVGTRTNNCFSRLNLGSFPLRPFLLGALLPWPPCLTGKLTQG